MFYYGKSSLSSGFTVFTLCTKISSLKLVERETIMAQLQILATLISTYLITTKGQGGISGFNNKGSSSSITGETDADNCNYIEAVFTAYYSIPYDSEYYNAAYGFRWIDVNSGSIMPTGICLSSDSKGHQYGFFSDTFS